MNTSAMTPYQQVQEQLAKLQEQLLAANPLFPGLLRTIHKQLSDDPEIVTLMTEEEIGILVAGLKRKTATEISTSKAKKAAGSAKRATALVIGEDL